MAKFLSRAEVYRIIQRELPPNVYPDGAPSSFWSTADSDATAKTIESLYDNLGRIYDNQWAQTADERILDWEVKYFGSPLTGSLTLQQRRDAILAKARNRPTLNPADMRELVAVYIGEQDVTYAWDYLEWDVDSPASGDEPCWSLGLSQLGYDTYLCGGRARVFGPTGCDTPATDVALTDDQLLSIREGAGTIELRIFERALDATVKTTLQSALDRFGRASRQHLISENVPYGEFLTLLPSTSLLLVADDYATTVPIHGRTYWYDRSPASNHAVAVGIPSDAAALALLAPSSNFLDRLSMSVPSDGIGFHAPGDVLTAATVRTYEIVIDNFGDAATEMILGRETTAQEQQCFWLQKNINTSVDCAVWPSTGFGGGGYTTIWMGGGYFEDDNGVAGMTPFWHLPTLFHVVVDTPQQTITVYRNGVHMLQTSNTLFGSLGALASPDLGIFGRCVDNGGFSEHFTGSILEIARHEVALSATQVAARAAAFSALKGY